MFELFGDTHLIFQTFNTFTTLVWWDKVHFFHFVPHIAISNKTHLAAEVSLKSDLAFCFDFCFCRAELVLYASNVHLVTNHVIPEMTELAGLFGQVGRAALLSAPPRYLLALIYTSLTSTASVRCGTALWDTIEGSFSQDILILRGASKGQVPLCGGMVFFFLPSSFF